MPPWNVRRSGKALDAARRTEYKIRVSSRITG